MSVQYKYRAIAPDGAFREGVVTADSDSQVLDYLAKQELTPLAVATVGERRSFSLWGFFKKTDYENLILFTNNLVTMYRAGIPLLRALTVMRVGPPGSRFNLAIDRIRLEVQSGKALSQAMAQLDDLFPRVYTTCIAAGEESGKLDEILDELATMLEQEMELTRQIKSGIRYPLIVITAIVAAFVVLITYVVPRFAGFYEGMGAQLPLPTRILLGTSDFLIHYWAIILAAGVVLVLAFAKLVSTQSGKLWVDRQLLRVPVFGSLIIKGNVARFVMMFRILFKSGLPIVKSLDILRGAVKNSMIALEIRKLGELFREGKDDILAQREFQYFPEMALQMMSIGLESGSLEKMLYEVGQHYSKEVHYTSRQLTAILEPILTLVLGVFVLVMALAIFMPMWNLISVFRGA